MTEIPLCSSKQVVSVLERLGFQQKRSRGSHATFVRERADGKDITVVPLGKREIPRGTLTNILKLANITAAEFVEALR